MSTGCGPSTGGGLVVSSDCGGSCPYDPNSDSTGGGSGGGGGGGGGGGTEPNPITGPYLQGVLLIHDGNINYAISGLYLQCSATGESYFTGCQWATFHHDHYGASYFYDYDTPGGGGVDCNTNTNHLYSSGRGGGIIPPPPNSATVYLNLTQDP